MSNCIPCPPCEGDEPLVCEPNETIATGNRVLVEDDAFCVKSLSSPSIPSTLIWNNGIKWFSSSGWQSITTQHYAVNGEKLSVNTAGGPVQIILPQNPGQLEEIALADHNGNWAANNVIVNRNGSLIEGQAQNLNLNTSWPTQIILRYENSTWRVFSLI
jgi:hypothetical protein